MAKSLTSVFIYFSYDGTTDFVFPEQMYNLKKFIKNAFLLSINLMYHME